MRSFFAITLIIASLIVPCARTMADEVTQQSAAQLKEEIRKLVAVESDPNTAPDVRTVNRIFIKKRQAELKTLLEKNIAGLRAYLSSLGSSLRSEERLIVETTIAQAEKDLQQLAAATTALNSATDVGSTSTAPNPNSSGNGNGASHNLNPSNNSGVTDSPGTDAPPSTNVSAQPQPQATDAISLNTELNARIRAKVRVDQTDNTKQTETPSISGASTSLVDQSSASDLIGLAANFAGLSASSAENQPEPSSVSVTASAYSLLAAIERVDPLNPIFYDKHRNWRKFAITLGYDDEDLPDGTKQRAKLFGGKFMFINRRDPGLERNKDYIDAVTARLKAASAAFGKLDNRVRAFAFSLETVRREIVIPRFKNYLEKRPLAIPGELAAAQRALATAEAETAPNLRRIEMLRERVQESLDAPARVRKLADNPGDSTLFVFGENSLPTAAWSFEERRYYEEFQNEFLTNYKDKLPKEVVDAIDEFIDKQLTEVELKAFRNLDDTTRDAVERIRRAPQFSLGFLTKQRRIGIDEYLGQLIFDYGVANRVNLTLNGAYRYNDSKILGGDVRGFSFSGQLRFQLNRENLLGKKPFFFDISSQGNWMNGAKSNYKTQAKFTLPIADGIEFPVSVTYANRTELIDEKDVRGQFGFTLDTARLIRAFLFR